ncbi:MAG: superoxide dismutase [Bacilli bacterium]
MTYTLPNLNYSYNALEPFIDESTMKIHHIKHHQAYIDQLNLALKNYPKFQERALKDILINLDKLPLDIQPAVRNHGGGHYNHSFFWTILKPNEGIIPDNEVTKAIVKSFGSINAFEEEFKKAALSRFGSGWAWLIINQKGALTIITTPNQDTPLHQGQPLIGIDLWEHAYYLHYQNRRADYIQSFFKIINWHNINQLYLQS